MRILALDIALTTGWAIFQDGKLKKYGSVKADISQFKDKHPSWYHFNIADYAAINLYNELINGTEGFDQIVIEQTNGGRNRWSQKTLEFLHCSFLFYCAGGKNNIYYIDTSEWRKILKLHATKDDLANNRKLNKAKKEGKSKKEIGIKGKITAKHRAVRFVNEKFNLNLKQKDDDVADAICLGLAYLSGAKQSTWKK